MNARRDPVKAAAPRRSTGVPPAVRRASPGHAVAQWDDRRARFPINDPATSSASSTALE
jgi:hypothetical protein